MKKFITILVCIMLACSMTVFAGGKKEATTQDQKVTIKWALWDWESTTYYKPLIEAYEAAHPNVKIEFLDLGSTDYMTMLSIQLTGGDSSIDVVTIKDIPGYNNLVKAGQLVDLKPYISSSGIDTSLYGGTTEQITVNNALYGLPFRSDFWIIFYNKALFDKAGVPYPTNDMTFDEFDSIARKMTSGSGANKVYGAHYHIWRSAVQLFGILDGKNTIVDPNYEYLIPYYERVLKQQDDGICQSYGVLKTTSTHYSGVFYNNSVAMMNMGSWFISTQIEKVKSGESLSKDWGLVKYPHAPGIQPGTTLGTITSIGVSSASKKQSAALDFVKFVSGPEGAAILADTGTIPAIMSDTVISTISSTPGFPSDKASAEALKTYKTYLEMPLHEKAGEIEVVLNAQHDNIMTKNTTIAQGIANMNKGVKDILK